VKLRLPLFLRRHLCGWLGHSKPITAKLVCCEDHEPTVIGHLCFYCLEHLETSA